MTAFALRRRANIALAGTVGAAEVPNPLNSILDLFVSARAAVGSTEWTWVQANTNTFESVLPPVGLRDDFASGTGILEMIPAWMGWVWNNDRLCFEYDGTGHSAAGCTERFSWSAVTRQHSLAFYGSEQIACPDPYYRAHDFNGTPPSRHPYGLQCYGKVRQRIYLACAGTFNSGNRGRVWDPAVTGDQPNGPDGNPGLRFTGIFEIDMSQAGTGKVLGATGSNPARGANAGTVLTGASAAVHHDWYAPGGPTPTFLSQVQAPAIEGAMVYTGEVAGKDAFYWTSGQKWLIRTTINSNNPADDTHVLIARESSAYGQGRGSVQISFDPTRRVVLAITDDVDTNPGCVAFADPKRPEGGSEQWRAATLSGNAGDITEFLALNRLDMGVQWDPISGKHLAWNGLGRQVWAITTPATDSGTGFTPDTGWLLEKLPMNATQPAPPTTPDPRQASGGVQIIGVNGKWAHADELRAMGTIVGTNAGNVWFLLGPGWTDPRA